MMHTQYQELLALTQLYLLQQRDSTEWVSTDIPTRDFYRAYYRKVHSSTTTKPIQEPVQVQAVPLPPVVTQEKPKETLEVKPKEMVTQQPVQQLPKPDFNDFRTLIAEHFPQQRIIDEISS